MTPTKSMFGSPRLSKYPRSLSLPYSRLPAITDPPPAMLRPHPSRRRPAYGPQLCAASAALLLLLSLLVLHSRLSSSPFPLGLGLGLGSVLPHRLDQSSSDPSPLFDDANNDAFDGAADDRIDELDVLDEDEDQKRRHSAEEDEILRAVGAGAGLDDDGDSDETDLPRTPRSGLFWDHALGVARQSFGKPDPRRPFDPWGDDAPPEEFRPSDSDRSKIAFGSDDQPVDEDLRLKLDSIRRIEDALLLKDSSGGGGESPLREGWARWLEGKGDFLRRNKMLRSNLELLIPKNHPLLQDPDGAGLPVLTRGDKMMQKVLLVEMEKTPFGGGGGVETKVSSKVSKRRRTLHLEEKKRPESVPEVQGKKIGLKEDRPDERWGYFPGLDPHLTFSEFMDRFLGSGPCTTRVFMVWNSPRWTYGIRHQRGLESLLHHHRNACVVVFSETMELDFFREFVKDGFKIAVAMPNLDELLKDTPTHVFASVWFKWRKTKHYPIHYSELIRLAALYKYGGIYLDSDIIVLNPLHSLENSIGAEDQTTGTLIINGAVMAFRKHSPFVMECLREFYSTYNDTLLRWNGADLMTRVMNKFSVAKLYGQLYGQLDIKIEPPPAFYPISSMNITRYFMEPPDDSERAQQDALLARMLNESITFHFWNDLTSALVPEPNSLVERLLNRYCLYCLHVL